MQRSGRATGKRGDLFNKRAASVWAAAFWQFCKCSEGRPFCAAFHPEFQNLSELMEWFYASKLRLFGDAVNKFFDQNHLQIAYRLLQICSRFEIQTRNSECCFQNCLCGVFGSVQQVVESCSSHALRRLSTRRLVEISNPEKLQNSYGSHVHRVRACQQHVPVRHSMIG